MEFSVESSKFKIAWGGPMGFVNVLAKLTTGKESLY